MLILWLICAFRKTLRVLMRKIAFRRNPSKNRNQNEAMGANGAGQKEARPCTQAIHNRAARLEKQQCGTV